MTRMILRDKTLDWIDRLFNGPYLNRACVAVIILAAAYFSPAFIIFTCALLDELLAR